jgi:protein-disulfide isomerase
MSYSMKSFHLLASLAFLSLLGCGDGAASGEAAPGAGAQPGTTAGAEAESGAPYASPEAAARAHQEAQDVNLARLGFNEGDEDGAVVQVIEFSDFGCVYCASFHIETYPALHEEFIQGGDVVWKYIPITLAGFPNADRAAIAGECAGEQERFAPMRDRLYETREEWMASDDPDGFLTRHAGEVGLDRDAFAQCMAESEQARRRIEDGTRIAQELGVRGTPTFIVQGHPVQGAPPLEPFQQVLRELVAEARSPGN